MHKIEYAILQMFKDNPEIEVSTSELVKKVFLDKYNEINNILNTPFKDKSEVQQAKRDRATLHKRILYHLNKLVGEDIIKVSREGDKGEKYFMLVLEKGEQLSLEKRKKKITIYKPLIPAMPLEGHEKKGLITKFETATWIDRVNSLLLECMNLNKISEIDKAIIKCFSSVNDVVGFNNFEYVLNNNKIVDIKNIIKKITSEADDYGKKLNFIIDLQTLLDKNKLIDLLRYYCEQIHNKSYFIFMVNNKWLKEEESYLTSIIDIFASNRLKLYLQNKDLVKAPYLIGRAGVYTFNETEWEIYNKAVQLNSYGIVCSQSTIAIDVKNSLRELKNVDAFKIFVGKTAMSLLSANSLQRRRAEEYFKPILWLTEKPQILFSYSRNFVRFWNYVWEDKIYTKDMIFSLLEDTKQEIKRFCIVEENIYKSCGIPTRFRIAFSSALSGLKQDSFITGENFFKIEIKELKDLYSDHVKEILSYKEKLFSIFSGGERIKINRKGNIDLKDIYREINYLLTSYNLPLLCYDFSSISGTEIKLTRFM